MSEPDRHFNQQAAEATMAHLSRQLETVMHRLEQGNASFVEVKVSLAGIEATMRGVIHELADVGNRVMALEADFNHRRGERGVWAALLNSKVAAWLVAAGLGVYAGLLHLKDKL